MSPRREEHTLRPPASLTLALLLTLAHPAAATSQDGPAIRGVLEAGPGLTVVHDEATALVEFALGLSPSPSWTVGGAGTLLTSPVALGEVGFQDVELSLGYGGLFVRWERPSPIDGAAWYGEILLGAGNGDVRDAATDLHLDSDNFLVVQPAVGLSYRLAGPAHAAAALSYRTVTGVEDLRGVRTSDLRSLSVHLRLRLTPL